MGLKFFCRNVLNYNFVFFYRSKAIELSLSSWVSFDSWCHSRIFHFIYFTKFIVANWCRILTYYPFIIIHVTSLILFLIVVMESFMSSIFFFLIGLVWVLVPTGRGGVNSASQGTLVMMDTWRHFVVVVVVTPERLRLVSRGQKQGCF